MVAGVAGGDGTGTGGGGGGEGIEDGSSVCASLLTVVSSLFSRLAVVLPPAALAVAPPSLILQTYFNLSLQKVSNQKPLKGCFPDTSKMAQSAVEP